MSAPRPGRVDRVNVAIDDFDVWVETVFLGARWQEHLEEFGIRDGHRDMEVCDVVQ